jgi:hypothetical protein
MTTINPHLEEARRDMERARQDAEVAKRVYNQKAKFFNEQLARYERLKCVDFDMRISLARERERALAEGRVTLAALLVSR